MNTPEPAWLTILKDLRRTANQPTLRELEHRSGVSWSHLSRYFSGRTLPKDEHLTPLLTALEANPDKEKAIVDDVRAARVEQRSQVGRRKTPVQPVPAGDLAALTEAINRLAAAIEKLAEK
jgi:transcriptional regulator with XRE-family HTH domain